MVLGDFNAKLSQWHGRDSSILKEFQLKVSHRITSLPTHILNCSSSCIDLIFTSQLNLSVESGTLPSLHQNRHHQIIYIKCNLEGLYLAAVTPANSIANLSDDLLMNLTGLEPLIINMQTKKVFIFNKIILNFLSNLIPDEVLVYDD